MKCPMCNAEVGPGAVFCQKCGGKLPRAADGGNVQADPAHLGTGGPLRPRNVRDVPEEVLWQGGYSPKAMVGYWTLASLVTVGLITASVALWNPFPFIGAIVLWVVLLGNFLLTRLGVSYKLTNQRFFHERGILRRVTNRIEVIDINDIKIEQGLIGRMLGVGKITLEASDTTDPELVLDGIDDVQDVAAKFDAARRAERLRRGVSIETLG